MIVVFLRKIATTIILVLITLTNTVALLDSCAVIMAFNVDSDEMDPGKLNSSVGRLREMVSYLSFVHSNANCLVESDDRALPLFVHHGWWFYDRRRRCHFFL